MDLTILKAFLDEKMKVAYGDYQHCRKQLIAVEEFCAKKWLKKCQEGKDRCTDSCYIAE